MSSPTLTRRGRVVLAVCVGGVAMAFAAGGRSLEAVVLPGAVALAAGYVQLARIDEPAVDRTLPPEGFVGEGGEVRLAFEGRDAGGLSPTYVADVDDALDDGLAGPDEPVRTSVGDAPATYRVDYLRRGERRFGPVTVTASDVFGLFEREAVVEAFDETLTYPACREIPARLRRSLYADDAVGASRRREEFDRLREYTRGDPLRDVHWAATAKHDELVVKAFAARTERGRVAIAGETAGDREGAAGRDSTGGRGGAADRDPADALASAAASLALALLDDGVPVDLTLPGGEVSADPGARGRRAVLELAARTGPGAVGVEEADARVVAGERGARYRIGDRTLAFGEVAGAPVRAAVGGGRGAGVDGTATEGESPEEGRGGATARGGVAAAARGEAAGRRDEVIGG
ncbi:DUF58 domain-containing protein [Halorubrum rutilum]|uniref:DUF58 domain-containing protein n=1 Tax=Halorubrum rutilum TaxID=1364933 RepID=UPI002111294E|nr:DUF58 domain-containing protein [Halorubrum rutilum]